MIDEVGRINPHGINANAAAEVMASRKAGQMGMARKVSKAEGVRTAAQAESLGTAESKPDIIRKTHLGIFNKMTGKGEVGKGSSGRTPSKAAQLLDGKKETTQKNISPESFRPDHIRTGMEDVGSRTVAIGCSDAGHLKASGHLDGGAIFSTIRQYLNVENGVYHTDKGYQLTIFRDPKTKLAYFTFLIPQKNGKMEEVSIFVNPTTPDKVNIFNRQIISPDQMK